jgi:hypothetical protein
VGILGGIGLVVAITLFAGGIAYIGDRVGHQVGRKRLTLFGLRPKYTSTIVAIGTGMLIALALQLAALGASQYVRAAFFRLSDISNRVNELEAQAKALNQQVRQNNVVVNRDDLLYQPYLLLSANESSATRLANLSTYFDAVVAEVNHDLVPRGLKAFKGRSTDPSVRARLRGFLADEKMQAWFSQGPVLVITASDQNLFVNDPVHFDFKSYQDKLIFRAHEPIAGEEVQGGTAINAQIAFQQLLYGVGQTALDRGMPIYYVRNPVVTLTPAQVQKITDTIRHGKGRFRIVALARSDVYPHTGGLPVELALVKAKT